MGYLGGINIALILLANNYLQYDFLTNTFEFFYWLTGKLGTRDLRIIKDQSYPELGFDDQNWKFEVLPGYRYDCFVVLTPTYPTVNSTRNVSRSSLKFMRSQALTIWNYIAEYLTGERVDTSHID